MEHSAKESHDQNFALQQISQNCHPEYSMEYGISDYILRARKADWYHYEVMRTFASINLQLDHQLPYPLSKNQKFIQILLSEVFPQKLANFEEVDC
ncbi:hypothetical protein KIN20_001701 [Parelaphostrongylus tenuis]|uniref:Uncharacterized protein n=1 Tax=Parelaphostrongylus tenuis TaxID=148309 RepID=A0AAD5LU30_PARTN|nr:hypothetical protein KIN20_001701 [Parelaphostrongylus tenuis]